MSKRSVLFGGSFDPLTYAHLSVIEGLSCRFDEVIVMPSHVSPFKRNGASATDEERLALLDECCAPYPNVTVSRYETDKDGVSFTYLTVKHLIEDEGKNVTIVIGSDMLADLPRWREIEYLSRVSSFYVVARPYYEIDEATLSRLTQSGIPIEVADFIGKEGSSTLLKVAVAYGKQSEIVPPPVQKWIEGHRAYRDYAPITQVYDRFFMKPARAEHSYRVAKLAIVLANLYGVDVNLAIRAAMEHDIGKYVSPKQLQEMGIRCDKRAFTCPKPVAHCYTSKAIAEQVLGETDPSLLRAIETHTTGDVDMDALQKIIFVADYAEEGRVYPGSSVARALSLRSLDEATAATVRYSLEHLKVWGVDVDERTLRAYEYYCQNK